MVLVHQCSKNLVPAACGQVLDGSAPVAKAFAAHSLGVDGTMKLGLRPYNHLRFVNDDVPAL